MIFGKIFNCLLQEAPWVLQQFAWPRNIKNYFETSRYCLCRHFCGCSEAAHEVTLKKLSLPLLKWTKMLKWEVSYDALGACSLLAF